MRHSQCHYGNHTDDAINGEEYFPSEPKLRHCCSCAPHSDIRSEERGDSLNELTKGQGRGEITAYDVRNQRIERGLHQRITDSQQGESAEHQRIRVATKREKERENGYYNREKNGLFTANLIHQHARGNGENQEPKEYERGHDISLRIGQTKVLFYVIAGNAYEVNKAHRKEAEHHYCQRTNRCFLIHICVFLCFSIR